MNNFVAKTSRYEIIKQIGQGQFGIVYCAKDLYTEQLVAIKELSKKVFSTDQFLRELSFLLLLHHPNIVSCHAIECHQTGRYIVMDYCEGGSLRDLMQTQSPSLIESLRLVADILSGLQYIHNKNIVHRDLKPENILLKLQPNGKQACICDLGIARLIPTVTSNTSESDQTGSPAYMAPERFYGDYSYASDLYAVGIILFELVVGRRPFSGNYKDLILAHISTNVSIPETVPFIVRSIITGALQKLSHKRFASATEMLKSVSLAIEVISLDVTE